MSATSPDPDSLRQRFREEFRKNQIEGRIRPLSEYLALFPGDDLELASEFRRLIASSVGAEGMAAATRRATRSGDLRRLGPYEIVRELGRGGQGTVYLATDTRSGQATALKVLTAWGGAGSDEPLQRFLREAEVASRLDHPGICGVLDTGVIDAIPYIAMRYVDGESLAARLVRSTGRGATSSMCIVNLEAPEMTAAVPQIGATSGPRSRPEIVSVLVLVERVAQALHAAHEVGVVHRDIKPANILVQKNGQPVILDFGLARAMDGDFPRLTRTGDVFGTPAYMSPEQVMGLSAMVDRRSDIWSLGVILYEGLTGLRPFDAPSRQGLSEAVVRQPLPDPTVANPNLDREVRAILAKALEKEPDRRYQTALDLAEDLRRARVGEPVRARQTNAIGRVLDWAKSLGTRR